MVGRVSVSVVGNGEIKFVVSVGASVLGPMVVGANVVGGDESSKGDSVAEKVMVDGGIDEGGVDDGDEPTQNSWSIGSISSFIHIELANQCQSDDKNTIIYLVLVSGLNTTYKDDPSQRFSFHLLCRICTTFVVFYSRVTKRPNYLTPEYWLTILIITKQE